MGEGMLDVPASTPEEGMDLPEVHTSLPTSSHQSFESTEFPSGNIPPSTLDMALYASTVNSNTHYPYPESPVVYALPEQSQLSTTSNSPTVCRPIALVPVFSSTNSLVAEEYIEKLHGYPYELAPCPPYSSHHLPSPIANTSNLSGVDSASMVLLQNLGLGSLDTKSNLSDSVSTMSPICRICHMPADDTNNLITPCRCAGSMQFIHTNCLMKWLEIISKHSRKPPKCELCHFQYHRHKKFKFNQFKCPKISRQDHVLHLIFLVMMALMIGCAIATVMCFLSDKGQISKFPRNKVDLTTEEIITLSCGVLFFVSFFVAMSVQIKARHTVYQLFLKFIMQNMQWEIDEYDKYKDSLFLERQSPKNMNGYKTPLSYV